MSNIISFHSSNLNLIKSKKSKLVVKKRVKNRALPFPLDGYDTELLITCLKEMVETELTSPVQEDLEQWEVDLIKSKRLIIKLERHLRKCSEICYLELAFNITPDEVETLIKAIENTLDFADLLTDEEIDHGLQYDINSIYSRLLQLREQPQFK